jgi:DNA-directed RNA polymerase subunit RPC12/RpoP
MDTDYTDFVTCPYCGYEDKDSWEIQFDNNGQGGVQCAECAKEFLVQQNISISYSTEKLKEKS